MALIAWFRLRRESAAKVRASVNERVRRHLGLTGGEDEVGPRVVEHDFPRYLATNVAVVVTDFLAAHSAEVIGLDVGESYARRTLADVLRPARVTALGDFVGLEPTAAADAELEVAPGELRRGLLRGLALATFEGTPVVALLLLTQDTLDASFRVEAVGAAPGVAERFVRALVEWERARSVLRGRLIQPRVDYKDEVKEATIVPHRPTGWDQLILPDELLARLRREVFDYVARGPELARNGLDLKRGVLLHGPPGTGKSMVCNLLVSQLQGFTSLLLTGNDLARVGGAFALARKLAPALLLFEDIDLVATGRDGERSGVLGALLNELDGVPSNEQVLFVFTTNRADVLEEALAQRPGRVDVALEFPLPSAALRRRLLRLYARRAHVDDAALEPIVAATEGATPAFLRELMKQTIFDAILSGDVDGEGLARIDAARLRAALERLTSSGHALERRFLGFGAPAGA
ncbi:MAG: ATP-binding protein [Planctomycetes bacterium]|nr:ATP-binding protein [Planctomycetota bacterium]